MTRKQPLGSFSQAKIPTEGQPISNARLVAELQALTLGIHLVGLDRLSEVMQGNRERGQ